MHGPIFFVLDLVTNTKPACRIAETEPLKKLLGLQRKPMSAFLEFTRHWFQTTLLVLGAQELIVLWSGVFLCKLVNLRITI